MLFKLLNEWHVFSSYLVGLYDVTLVVVQQLFCGVLLPVFVPDHSQHSCVVETPDDLS